MTQVPKRLSRPSRFLIKALLPALLCLACTRSPGQFIMPQSDAGSKLSQVTLTPPTPLQNKIQTGLVDAVAVEIIPGKCLDGSVGTRLDKTVTRISAQTLIRDIKLKSRCEYKLLIEIGKLDPVSKSLGKIYLSNIENPTTLAAEDVEGDTVNTRAKLFITAEGKNIFNDGPSDAITTPNQTIPQQLPQQEGPQLPAPQQQPPEQPVPQQPGPQTPQILPQDPPLGPQAPGPSISSSGMVTVDFVKFSLPSGYKVMQTAKDGDVIMLGAAKDATKLTIFSRKTNCSLKIFVASGAQTVAAETPLQSSSRMAWQTMVTKFSSKYSSKTVYSGLFSFSKDDSPRCIFGYVVASTLETAQSEIKSILSSTTLSQ
jgi:hypothetical protein